MMKKSKSLVKTRMFLSYLLAFILLLTTVFFFGYIAFSRAIIQNKLESHEIISRQMSRELVSRFERPIKIAMQFNLSKWVERMMYMQKYPSVFQNAISALEVRAQSQQIKLMEVSTGFDEQIVLYFSQIDAAISNYGQSSWADYCSYYGLSGPNENLVNGALLKSNNQQLLIPGCSMRINGRLKRGFAFLQTIPLNDIKNGDVNLFYFLPLDTLADQALSYYHQGAVSLFLQTPDQTITPLSLSDANSTHGDVQSLFELVSDAEEMVYDNQTDSHLLSLPLQSADNTLLVVLYAQSLQEDLDAAFKTFLLIYVLVLMLALLFSNLLANRGYQPLKRLITNISVDIRPPEGVSTPQDEYAMVDLAMRSLLMQRERLDQLHSKQMPMVQRYLLLQALHPPEDGNDEELTKTLESVLPGRHYSCFLLDAPPQMTQEVLARFFESQQEFGCIDVKMAKYRLVVVGYQDVESLSALWGQLGDWATENNVRIGWSEEHIEFSAFREAYQEAMTAIAYYYFSPDKGIIRYQEIRSREAGRVVLRAADVAALKYEIQKACQDQAVEELYALSLRLIEDKRSSVRDYQSAMNALANQLRSQLQQDREDYPVQPFPRAEAFPDCMQYINEFARQLRQQMRVAIGEYMPSNEMLIVDYIRDHLTDSSLSQSQVAEALGYTPSYFSRYFREKFHCSWHEYIAQRRVQLAKQLMDDERYAVAQLAEKTGFTNDASFRRVFKSLCGMTPSQYQQHKGKE